MPKKSTEKEPRVDNFGYISFPMVKKVEAKLIATDIILYVPEVEDKENKKDVD